MAKLASAKDFMERNHKEITLPSGLTVKIRKLPVLEFAIRQSAIIARNGDGKTDQGSDAMTTKELICLCLVQPAIVMGRADYEKGELSIDDLGVDIGALSDAIMDFSIGRKEVGQVSFPPEGLPRESGQSV